MSLQNLKPAAGSSKDKGNVWGEVKVPVKVEQLQEDTKGLSPGQGIKRSVSKEVKCPFKDVFPNLDLRMSIELNIKINLDTIQIFY